MHFRFRGNNIQVVKTVPDPTTGKAKSIPMGSINRATMVMSYRLRLNCSAKELGEIQAWVKGYQAVYEMKRKHAALTLPEQMAAAIEWFEQAPPDEARQTADDVRSAMVMLHKVLIDRGLL